MVLNLDPSNTQARTAIIISVSSDIGLALASRWLESGWHVVGTYRTRSEKLEGLERKGLKTICYDVSDQASTLRLQKELASAPPWDAAVIAPASLEPVGPFESCDIDQWERSIYLNFTGQMRVVHGLLPMRNRAAPKGPCVLLFAGGGANNAPLNYSAYIVSKLAQTKMCEILDAEIPDTRFTILGPGWVKTKIHDATFAAGDRAGENLEKAKAVYSSDAFTSMEDVLDCCDWAIEADQSVIGGRNFSVVHDQWGSIELEDALRRDTDLYKLRRFGNGLKLGS